MNMMLIVHVRARVMNPLIQILMMIVYTMVRFLSMIMLLNLIMEIMTLHLKHSLENKEKKSHSKNERQILL
jgi:hypothetical protein